MHATFYKSYCCCSVFTLALALPLRQLRHQTQPPHHPTPSSSAQPPQWSPHDLRKEKRHLTSWKPNHNSHMGQQCHSWVTQRNVSNEKECLKKPSAHPHSQQTNKVQERQSLSCTYMFWVWRCNYGLKRLREKVVCSKHGQTFFSCHYSLNNTE